MDFLNKLNYLMEQHKLNKHTLSLACGVPYTTIDSFYKKGYSNAKLSTIQKIADYFNTSIDYLMRDEISDPKYGVTGLNIDIDEKDIIDKYRETDEYGRETVRFTVNREYKRTKEQSKKPDNIVEIPNEEAANNDFVFKEIARDTYGTKQKYKTEINEETTESLKNLHKMGKLGEFNVDDHDI